LTAPAGAATTAADMARFMLAHLQNGRLGTVQMLSAATTQLDFYIGLVGGLISFNINY
jgi:CubicO group peptidase (beta-lactamase class C family)